MPPALSPPPRRVRENRTRYVVLGMLREAPMTGYALRQRIAQSVGHFWQESFGQLYPTLRRLEAEGLLRAAPTPGGPGRGTTTWHLTSRGQAELARWLALPPAMEPQRNEVLLKVYFAGAVPGAITDRNLELVEDQVRSGLAELDGLAASWTDLARGHPDAPFWRLTLEFGRTFSRTALAWIARARAVVRAQAPGPRARRTNQRNQGARPAAARPRGT
jgi:PadR family transcriptional regulator AphA